jgi:NAD-dependent SIR2 family protein deacetylase
LVKSHQPNAGHFALAALAQHVARLDLITQCVDRYHQQAGQNEVIELHGNLVESRCLQCGAVGTEEDEIWREELPYCLCGGLKRPAVVCVVRRKPASGCLEARVARSRNVFDLFFHRNFSAGLSGRALAANCA